MRGYNVGELATCRRYASAAAELRVPLLRQQAYAFAEWGSDLGSSGALRCLAGCVHWVSWQSGAWRRALSAGLGGWGGAHRQPQFRACLAVTPTSHHPPPTAPPDAGEVRGNPTEYYRRPGSGSSCGAGLKVGAVRAELVRDNNSGKSSLWLAYGERF